MELSFERPTPESFCRVWKSEFKKTHALGHGVVLRGTRNEV